MKIYLVRHGQCESNVIGRYNFVDEDINETGIKQAEDLLVSNNYWEKI